MAYLYLIVLTPIMNVGEGLWFFIHGHA